MFKAMCEFEQWFLLKLERLSHWTQVHVTRTDFDAFVWAQWSIRAGFLLTWLLWTVAAALNVSKDPEAIAMSISIWDIAVVGQVFFVPIFLLMYAPFHVFGRHALPKLRTVVYEVVAKGSRNPIEEVLRIPRLACWALLTMTTVVAPLEINLVVGILLSSTFISTTPLHPNEALKRRAEKETRDAQHLVA